MRFMLDTNICIYIINKRPEHVFNKFRTFSAGTIGLSSITEAELYYGAEKSRYPEKNKEALFQFLLPLELTGFDSKASSVYGNVRAKLEKAGKVIGAMDLSIASHALSIDATLVTNNEKEFRRIEGLKLANWAKE